MLMRAVVVSLVALTLWGCPPAPGTVSASPAASPIASPPNLVLRSYDVPNGGAQRMRSVLTNVISNGFDKPIGRADVGPDGRLLVLAPESVHEGVKGLLTSVAANPVKEPDTVRLDYWVVSGVPGKSEAPGAQLKEVAPALAEIEKNDGPMAFALVEKLAVSSQLNDRGSMNGREVQVRQFINSVNEQIVADLEIIRFDQKLQTRARMKPGVITVMASAGMSGRGPEKGTFENRSLYFLVRAASTDGSGR